MNQVILASGCFWCTEAVFKNVRGVQRVESGYIGGHVPNPTYNQVCGGDTGHAEAVRLTYDPNVISSRDLLGIFFATHDPTQLNRQGADVGTQYRSAVFYANDEERQTAQAVIDELNAGNVFDAPVVTTLEPATTFYVAEGYHQDYYERNPGQPYCMAVITPKVIKFRKQFSSYLS
ncbi:peptide-methionine (S)-S-oxide reductase MsrA [Deinococcus maricopensis]|uniref:Peptide methionine sulfoxide reductase MsrA n=1 Tax=Deinococcus maricopensis (strain DSM 21211 / LMG 22137 / NRRL B-23946 / LB-34) TaxID=709986 RepID=E8U8P7_DEIML|nr:peptide-methionine (S)-S-oxide reductase MsrA [Deinococcus maricopensis]ADV67436.1 Peptide methionine sulfoxide reductase msrA [Deinococcus maricopensis DSM 21211]